MPLLTKEIILDALTAVLDPETGQDVVSAGLISSIVIREGRVGFAIEVEGSKASEREQLRRECEAVVKDVEGVHAVTVVLTAVANTALSPAAPQRVAHKDRPAPAPITGVRQIIAVGSGKGGVGKSTVSVNLAVTLVKAGYKVGLVDADIYGPSVPRMLGVKSKPEIRDNKMVPLEAHGIKAVSMGFLLGDDVATVWRGPMVSKALFQLIRGTIWGELDFLVIDMPPGTGDIHISLAQNYPLSGAVIVSTPQDIALLDVRKAINMFEKVTVPILGIVENMSYFLDPNGHKNYIFGQEGARRLARELKLDFLGEIPLDPAIRAASDDGTPLATEAYRHIAERVVKKVASGVQSSEFSEH